MKKIRTNIHLTEEQRAALRKYAKKTGTTPAELVRRSINFYIEYITGRSVKDKDK